MKQDKFAKVIKSIIKLSGGSIDKVNLEQFIFLLKVPLLFPWNFSWNSWLGVIIQKSPSDLMILQEIMFEKRPDTIIECGTCYGGSAYYMANLMDLMNINGKIFTIDHHKYPPLEACYKKDLIKIAGDMVAVDMDLYQTRTRPKHPKIKYILSDCLSAKIPNLGARTMVILDCDHSTEHVNLELEKYSNFVTVGQYIIVEDTIIPDKTNSPARAVKKFLSKNKNFVVDKSREKFELSTNHGGYLLRV